MERIKATAGDPLVDKEVKTTLLMVLHAWKKQFSGSPQHAQIAGLFDNVKVSGLYNLFTGFPEAER